MKHKDRGRTHKRKTYERERDGERKKESHPVFGKEEIDGGVSNDVHAQLKGLDLPGLPRLGHLGHLHVLVVGRQKELPQAVPAGEGEGAGLFTCKAIVSQRKASVIPFYSCWGAARSMQNVHTCQG